MERYRYSGLVRTDFTDPARTLLSEAGCDEINISDDPYRGNENYRYFDSLLNVKGLEELQEVLKTVEDRLILAYPQNKLPPLISFGIQKESGE